MADLWLIEELRRLKTWRIEHQLDYGNELPRGSSDADVVTYAGVKGWAVLTSDEMRYTPETMQVAQQVGTQIFKVVGSQNMQGVRIRSAVVVAQDRILRMMRENPGHFVAHIHAKGSVVMMKAPTLVGHRLGELTDTQRKTVAKYGSRPLLDGLGVG